MLIARRSLLRGLFALPAVVAVGSLMPISAKKLLLPPTFALQPAYLADGDTVALLSQDGQVLGWGSVTFENGEYSPTMGPVLATGTVDRFSVRAKNGAEMFSNRGLLGGRDVMAGQNFSLSGFKVRLT